MGKAPNFSYFHQVYEPAFTKSAILMGVDEMENITLGLLIVLGLASFRLTRLIVFDKITEFLRLPFLDEVEEDGEIYMVPKPSGIRKWIGGLLSCYWCTGVWASAGLLALYVFLPKIGIAVIVIFAVAAIGGILETIISRLLGS